ncbi:MAG: aminodeoxychorismate synthase component I [Gemmatimonadota bacterium]|nr:aminodeoxychorismate synthase component I [Gemmatimonadota bacterium]
MTAPPTAHFKSFGARRQEEGKGWNVSLRHPRSVLIAQSLDDVIPLLREAESAAARGSWVALALSYDAAPAFDSALDTHRDADFPLLWCGIFDDAVSPPSDYESAAPTNVASANESSRASKALSGASESEFEVSPFEPALEGRDYLRAIEAIRNYIAAGDTYQVNYTFPLRGTVSGNLFACFDTVARSQGAGYSAYIDIGSHQILSFSPELFFRRDGTTIITKPMKGTARRGRWLSEDDERAAQLAVSQKDRAENVMIVDLLRNDLGRIAEVGSVEVTALFEVERFNRVLQMTSTIRATQRADADLVSVLSALFPCGSVTGAPKVRSTQIIRELEPFPRGIYTGAIGLLSPSGDIVFNVAIRTLAVDARTRRATLGVGGGITWDSTVESEYDESLVKASFLTDRWPGFSLLETLALIDGEYKLLERHLKRASDSARYFGFRFSEGAVRKALDVVAERHATGEWRVRLLVDTDGNPRTEIKPLGAKRDEPRRVKLFPHPIDDTDALLYHKISARERYDAALEECQPCDDVIFRNSRGNVTESTIANIVLAVDGKKWTPPREAGLLAGTFREELIETGQVLERDISVAELERVGEFWLVNSVRGWMRARIQ